MKQLAGQTAIYGLSSILGRMINFLLVPLQTAVLSQSEYGVNVDFLQPYCLSHCHLYVRYGNGLFQI